MTCIQMNKNNKKHMSSKMSKINVANLPSRKQGLESTQMKAILNENTWPILNQIELGRGGGYL